MADQLSPPPPPDIYLDPNDLLVTPPGAGFDGWFTRVVGALRRNWRTLLPIILVTQVLPALLIDLMSLPLSGPDAPMPDGGALLALLGLAFASGIVTAIGWAAGTWAVARQAVGEPGSVGGALRYGLERALGLFGWYLLASLLIAIGLCAFIVPGVYLALVTSMVAPVFLFERTNPIGRSFRIFHARPGMMLGRLSLVVGAAVVGFVVVGLAQVATLLALGADAGFSAASVTTVVFWDLLSLPVYAALLVGPLITYAEQRGQEAPVNAARLAEELG